MPRLNCHVCPGRCGAQTRATGQRCRNFPVPGRKRCRLHGGLSTGPKGAEGKHRVAQAMAEGRRHWVEQMRAAVAAGLIKRFPCGRKPRRWMPAMRPKGPSTAELMAVAMRGAEAKLSVLRGLPLTERRDALIKAGKRAAEQLEKFYPIDRGDEKR